MFDIKFDFLKISNSTTCELRTYVCKSEKNKEN